MAQTVAVIQLIESAFSLANLLVGGTRFEAERFVMRCKIDFSHNGTGKDCLGYGRILKVASELVWP